MRPGDAANFAPSANEGAGNAGCLSHPQPCVQVKKARKQITTGTPKQSGAPCTMVYGLFRALPGVPGLIASVTCGIASVRLDPSVGRSGPRGFARPRATSYALSISLASIASRSNVCGDWPNAPPGG